MDGSAGHSRSCVQQYQASRGRVDRIGGISTNRLIPSKVAMGVIRAGTGITCGRDVAKAREPATRFGRVVGEYGTLPMVAAACPERARIRRGESDILIEDARIAATVRVHRFAVATRDNCDFRGFGVELFNPFEPSPEGSNW